MSDRVLLALLIVGGVSWAAWHGYAQTATDDPLAAASRPAPAIDARQPQEFKTATFALG